MGVPVLAPNPKNTAVGVSFVCTQIKPYQSTGAIKIKKYGRQFDVVPFRCI